MKNFTVKLVGTMAIVCLLSFLGYARINHSEKLDDLLLENIEALAADESGNTTICVGSGSIVCPITKGGVEHVYICY
ncbi:NVEALA domain-containing protein [uncultured Bacteroides sp.]|uniref:NVEALA domain-containing protein n=1 Tax=uncultured Bacteroides sp. TaxID=162156 RepID=UPI0011DE229C|nr:NVEALA domain-containing protein [uncultured Bacteroides sp.]